MHTHNTLKLTASLYASALASETLSYAYCHLSYTGFTRLCQTAK
jgi:hypothetical protein